MKEMMKNALILIAITVISGLILGLVYETTKDTVAAREEADKVAAYKEVFEAADSFEPPDNEIMTDAYRAVLDEEGYGAVRIDEVLKALDVDGTTLGYVYNVTTSEGYGGDITLAVGIDNSGTIGGISILTINETAGLGMNAEKVLKPQFKGRQADRYVYSKTGATAANEIDAISGATITTNAFVNAVNCCLKYQEDNG